jgi:transcriptional regulator of met regulon
MDNNRIKEIQKESGWSESVSVHLALLQVWNEVAQEYEQQIAELKQLIHSLKSCENCKHSFVGDRYDHDCEDERFNRCEDWSEWEPKKYERSKY